MFFSLHCHILSPEIQETKYGSVVKKKNITVYIKLPRHPFDRLIIEFRRSKASSSSKKGGRSKRSRLGNQIQHKIGNLEIGQNYNTRKVYLVSSFSKNQGGYITKQRQVFSKKNNKMNSEGFQIRRKRSFARHRNILRGRGGRGRGQQFRFMRMKMRRLIKIIRLS